VVVDPHDQDRGEAGDERQVRRPLASEGDGQRRTVREVVRHLEVEHQERHRNGEHAVAERFDPAGFAAFVAHEAGAFRHIVGGFSVGEPARRKGATEAGTMKVSAAAVRPAATFIVHMDKRPMRDRRMVSRVASWRRSPAPR
jgi:hypothetical protein